MNEQDFDFNPNIKTKTRLVEEEPDELGRRKWKLEHYEEEEGPKEDLGILNQDPRTESFLVGRTEKLAINSKIGRGDALKKTMKQGGFFCDVCRQLYKCDSAFLTHLNSASHNRKLGMSLKVEGVAPEAVRSKLAGTHNGDVVLSQKQSSKPSAMELIVNKATRKHLKQEQKAEEKHYLAQKQAEEIASKNVVEHQNIEKPVCCAGPTPEKQYENPSTLQEPDEAEQMMKALGLPTSFGSKKGGRR